MVADVIADLNGLALVLDLASAAELQDFLALLVRTFIFFAPLLVFPDLGEEYQLFTVVAGDLQNLNELFQNMGGWPDSELPWALKRAVFLPFVNALLAKKTATLLTIHWFDWNLEANATYHGVPQLSMHLSIYDSRKIVPTLIKLLVLILLMGPIHHLLTLVMIILIPIVTSLIN